MHLHSVFATSCNLISNHGLAGASGTAPYDKAWGARTLFKSLNGLGTRR